MNLPVILLSTRGQKRGAVKPLSGVGLFLQPLSCLIKVSLCKRVQQRLDGTLSLGLSHRLIGILTSHDRT